MNSNSMVIEMIKSDTIDSNNALFRVFQKGKLTDNDYNSVSELKLLTNKGQLQVPKNCYLLDCYQPQLKIQSIFPEGCYVSNKYVENDSGILQWKKFLTKIGVKEKIDVKIEPIVEKNKLIRENPNFDFIDNNDVYPV